MHAWIQQRTDRADNDQDARDHSKHDVQIDDCQDGFDSKKYERCPNNDRITDLWLSANFAYSPVIACTAARAVGEFVDDRRNQRPGDVGLFAGNRPYDLPNDRQRFELGGSRPLDDVVTDVPRRQHPDGEFGSTPTAFSPERDPNSCW